MPDDETGDLHAIVQQQRRPRWLIPASVVVVLFVSRHHPLRPRVRDLHDRLLRQLPRDARGVHELATLGALVGRVRRSATCRRAAPPPSSGAPRRRATSGRRTSTWSPPTRGVAARERELHQVPPSQGPDGHPGRAAHAARPARQPEQPDVHRLSRPHVARGPRVEQRREHASLHDVPRADQRSRPVLLLPLHRPRGQVPPRRLHHGARQARPGRRAGLPALSPRQGAVLRHLSRQAAPGHYTGDWRYAHGKQAEKDRDLCYGCHSYEELCKQCHQVSHPDGLDRVASPRWPPRGRSRAWSVTRA